LPDAQKTSGDALRRASSPSGGDLDPPRSQSDPPQRSVCVLPPPKPTVVAAGGYEDGEERPLQRGAVERRRGKWS
jgi:hypothetical protein